MTNLLPSSRKHRTTTRVLPREGWPTLRKHAEDYTDAFVFQAELRERGEVFDLASYPAFGSAERYAVRFSGRSGLALTCLMLFDDPAFVQVYFVASDTI
jgi:hypothetical protein